MTTDGQIERPQPISEIVITSWLDSKNLRISTYSESAEAWVKREAPSFGQLLWSESERKHILFVEDGYDTEQVKAWLEQGESKEKSTS
jgi:hypothetical protein